MLPNTLEELYSALKSQMDDLEVRRLIEVRTGCTWSDIMAYPDKEIAFEALQQMQTDGQRRQKGEPLSRILGVREFWGHEFKITPYTLDPRPETEQIVEMALKHFQDEPPQSILDLGTGTGCLPVTLLKEFPNAKAVAADISSKALDVAKENAAALGVADRIEFIESDWFANIKGDFDLIVSNPPYIAESVIPELAPEVKNHDPILALEGGKDGLNAYRQIFSKLFLYLKPEGIALFEVGFDQGDNVMRLSEESRLLVRGLHRDLAGHARVLEVGVKTSSGDK